MSLIICTGLRATVTGAGAGSATRARGKGAGASWTRGGRVAKIGAGCGPCCRNSALIKIAKAATVVIRIPTNSRGCRPIAAANRPTPPSKSLCRLRLRTFLHRYIAHRGEFMGPFCNQMDRLDGTADAFAIDRQTHRHPRPVTQPAVDIHVAAVGARDTRAARRRPVGSLRPDP